MNDDSHYRHTPERALVTGGSGFLGRATIEKLLERGDHVRSLHRGHYPELEDMGVEVIRGDVRDASVVRKAAEDCDVVYHVAAKSGFWGAYREYHETNVQGTHNVLNACKENGVGRLVYTSSPSVLFHGGDMQGVDESAPYPRRFISNYSATKAKAEQAVLAANSADLKTIALRPHLIWGPRDNHIVPRFIAQGAAGKLRCLGDGQNLVDVTYIDNAADAQTLAADALSTNPNAAGRAFFISQGEPIKLWDIINGILAAAGVPPVNRSLPRAVGWTAGAVLEMAYKVLRLPGEPRMTRFVANVLYTHHWFDISAARRELGYQPRVTVEQGLERLETWLRKTGRYLGNRRNINQ